MQGWTIGSMKNGSGTTATSAAQLTSADVPCDHGVCIKANPANGGIVYVGFNSDLTAGSAAPTTDGFPLSAGEAIDLEIDNANKVYVIGSDASQKFHFIRR